MGITTELLRKVQMLDGLQDSELAEIVSCFALVDVGEGEEIYREGDAATDACFLISGELRAKKLLPGGGATEVGTISPGALIGEMALISGGERTATVEATAPSIVLKVSYYFFHAALDQMSVPAFKVLRAIIRNMAERLDELEEKILGQWHCGPGAAPARRSEKPARLPVSFDFRPFLSVLPCFEDFNDEEIDLLFEAGGVMEVPRGAYLHREGALPDDIYLVLRGAVEKSVMRDRRYQLSVLGPGRFCGANAMITKRPHRSDARLRSSALLLCLPKAGFEELFDGGSTACLKFQNLVSANQLKHLRAANNLLALLVSQDQVLSQPFDCVS